MPGPVSLGRRGCANSLPSRMLQLMPKLGQAHTRCFSCSNAGLAEATMRDHAQLQRRHPSTTPSAEHNPAPTLCGQNPTKLTAGGTVAALHVRTLRWRPANSLQPTARGFGSHSALLVAGAGCGCGAFSGMPWSTVKSLRSLPGKIRRQVSRLRRDFCLGRR